MTSGSSIAERIMGVVKEKGIKKGAFYKYAGITSNTIINWRKQNSIPAADTAIKMAEFLNVSVKWLIMGEEDEMSNDEIEMLKSYRLLDKKDKDEIMGIITLKLENAKKTATLSSSETG